MVATLKTNILKEAKTLQPQLMQTKAPDLSPHHRCIFFKKAVKGGSEVCGLIWGTIFRSHPNF